MDRNEMRQIIAKRVALELHDGDVVKLGIGLPTLVPNYLKPGVNVILQSENGLIGMGPTPKEGEEDLNFINAGGGATSANKGAACFDSASSFAIIRGGHVDVSILGALQVDEKGNLANWIIPGKIAPGMGGAMDLLIGTRKVILAMEHTARGNHKIMKKCTLPLTAEGQVDLIVTEMCVIETIDNGLLVVEINPRYTQQQVQEATNATLIFSPELKEMRL